MLKTSWTRVTFIIILIGMISFRSFSQNFDYTRPSDVISPSPVAASLFKDVNVPVNFYTGTPNIDISLHVIKGGKLKMPINLKYTASGIKVEQEAGLTGLAWDLQTGGVISRAIVGKADEGSASAAGYRYSANNLHLPDPGHDDSLGIWGLNISSCDLLKLAQGKLDLCPDNYFLNFNGNSARMFFDKYGQPYFSPYKKWKITGDESDGFTIVTDDGTTYIFDVTESSHDQIEAEPNDNTSISTSNTSWFLSRIISADKADTMNLHYAQVTYSPASYHLSETHGYLIKGQNIANAVQPNTDFQSTVRYTHLINGYILADITTKDEKVVFYNSMGRTDIVDGDDGMPYKLDSIRYFMQTPEGGTQLLSREIFNYDYYNPASTRLYQRLRLLSVSNTGANDETGDVYQFHYDGNNNLPARNSFGEDSWGYFNGNSSNTLVPKFTNSVGQTFAGANRDPDTTLSLVGLLTSIQYPTGGTTSFEYETHMYNMHAPGERDSLTLNANADANTGPVTSTTPTFDSSSFYIPFEQFVTINYNSDAKAGEEGDVIAWLVEGQSKQLNPNIWEYNAGALSHSGTVTLLLHKGLYTICVQKAHLLGEHGFVRVQYQYHVVDPAIGTVAGGARIKRMVQSDGKSRIIKNFRYLTDSVTSSGKLLSSPVYSGIQNIPAQCSCTGGGQVGNWRYQVYHSMPTADLGRAQGGHICYTHVQVLNGDLAENGREEYDFQYTLDAGSNGYPYAPLGSMDDFRGQLLTKRVFDASGKLLEREENTYNLSSDEGYPNFKQIWGVKVGNDRVGSLYSGGCPFVDFSLGGWSFNMAMYPVMQLWPTLSSTRKTLFSTASNDSVATIERMDYDTLNLQLSTKKTWNSKGDSVTDFLKYPHGFTGTAVYDTMIARNIIAPVIENYEYYNTTLRSKGIMNYQLWPATAGTVPLPVSTQLQNGSFPLETRIQFLGYDNNSNLLSQSKAGDVPHSYIWDYWNHWPVAEAVNAPPGDIGYTSFEWDGTGGFTIPSAQRDLNYSVTGKISYDLSNGSISKAGLTTSKTYVVSYWSRSGSSYTVTGSTAVKQGRTINGWTYFQHTLTGTSTISIAGSGAIDELRLYPQGAQMTTYTYQPLVGMTSQCDIGNRVTYYEYDGLQRLKYIRDQDRNIVKSYEYQYQGASGCGSNCYIIAMQTFAGTNTLGYPVGVFDVHGKLLGNATTASQYVTLWNADTADARIGTLATGGDSLHFNMTLNASMTLPAGVIGCRYYQVDLAWNQMDGVRNFNGVYVDFGDSTGMRLAAHLSDSLTTLAPNTIQSQTPHPSFDAFAYYFVHSYPDTSLKTLTFYHNDATELTLFDNLVRPAISLSHLKNLQGNLPQHTTALGGNSYQQSSMMSVANVTNWNSIHSITSWGLGTGDAGVTPCLNPGYQQDFMAGNPDLTSIGTAGNYFANYFDSTFKISRLKSDWNTYFKHLQSLFITDGQWNREDLSGLKELNSIWIMPARQHYSNDPTGNPEVPIPDSVINNIYIQVAAGAGQAVTNGVLSIYTGGGNRTAASDAAVATLLAKGWTLNLNGIRITAL